MPCWPSRESIRRMVREGLVVRTDDGVMKELPLRERLAWGVVEAAMIGDEALIGELLDPDMEVPAAALIGAAEHGHVGVIKYLVARGADLNAVSQSGTTALMAAAWSFQTETVKALLSMGADPGVRSTGGQTALDVAREMLARHGRRLPHQLELIRVLEAAERRHDANAPDGTP